MGKKRLLITVILSIILIIAFHHLYYPRDNRLLFDIVNFSSKKVPLKIEGFTYPESFGRWTSSSSASLMFRLNDNFNQNLDVKLKLRAFARKNKNLDAEVFVNNKKYADWHFTPQTSGAQNKIIHIDKSLLKSGQINITFKFKELLSPKDLGINEDSRKLGLGLETMEITSNKPYSYFNLFNILMFIIVSTFSFLLSYKLIQYLAKFKILEHYSRIDIVFLCAFFLILLVPISKIDSNEKSEQENRMLAKYVSLIDNQGHINLKYGKNFEAWFNDHFNFRKKLLKFYASILYNINRYYQNSFVIKLKDNWLFDLSDLKFNQISEKELSKIKLGILSFKNFCEENDIKCYIEVVPSKLTFAQDKTFIKNYKSDKEVGFVIWKYFQNIFPIVFPIDEMLAANKQDYVYFKTDHHWTEWGAYIGYLALMEKIKKDFPQVKAISEQEYNIFYSNKVRAEIERRFWSGLTCKNLNQDKCILDQKYKYYTHKQEQNIKVLWEKDTYYKYFQNPMSNNDLKVVIIGNSFAENFVSFLPYTFKEVKKYRVNTKYENNLKLSRWQREIKNYKPEILIVLVHSSYSFHLSELKD